MVKVGKINLTPEQRKRTFHLPIEQAVIVPSTSGVKTQKRISQAQLRKRVNNVRRFMSKRFGGFTDVRAVGGFILKDGKIVKERVIKVTSFATKKDFKKNEPQMIRQVRAWGKNWKQQSVSYENEGDLFIIEPPKRGSQNVMKRVIGKKMVKVRVPVKRKATSQQLKNLIKARRARKR